MATFTADMLWQLRFEHDRVKMLLAAFDFPEEKYKQHLAELREAGRQRGSDGYLTFDSFFASDRFYTCPVRLQARSISASDVDRLTMPYFLNFEKTYLHQMYLAAWCNRDEHDGRPFGLVVNMPKVRGGVVIHDADLPGLTCRTTLVHKSLSPDEPPVVTVEPYKAFARRLVKHWTAAKPVPATKPRDAVQPRLERWMVEWLGSGPAALVLAWLHGAWHDAHKRYVMTRSGVACLCLTQAVIAEHSGLPEDSVKHGLATLKEEGLIATKRGDRRTYIFLAGVDEGE